MGFRKIYEIYCDNNTCGAGIDYWEGSLETVKRIVRDNGSIVKGSKCFCNEKCYKEYMESHND